MQFTLRHASRARLLTIAVALPLVMAIVASTTRTVAEPDAEAKVDFARDIRPLLAASCFKCHGPQEEEGGLRLDVRKRVLEGGASGPALVPGKSAESLIWQFITGRNDDKIIMPPKGRGARLTPAQCELVRRWIDAGAAWGE